jgi:Peptidase family M1 domain
LDATIKLRGGGRCMHRLAILLAGLLLIAVSANAQQAPPHSSTARIAPRQLLRQLDSVTLDPDQVFSLRNAEIAPPGVQIYFNRGFVGFFKPVAGKVTGALFVGNGEVLVRPPFGAERQSMKFFTGAPILEEQFTTMYMRFTGDVAQRLRRQSRPVDPRSTEQPGNFAADAALVLERLNPAYSLRVLEDLIGNTTRPYFHARANGVHLGVFEVNVDERLSETVSVEAIRTKGAITYRDVWCSFRPGGPLSKPLPPFEPPARVLSYKISTWILQNNSLEGRAELQMVSQSGADRCIGFNLSHRLQVTSVKDSSGKDLVVFQNPFLKHSQALRFGADWMMVVLPAPHPAGQKFTLTFTYQGDVIAGAASDLLFVGAHESWYPNLGVNESATYELSFRYPERLTLVATGQCVQKYDVNGWKHSHWISDGPFAVAGFNLGQYNSRTVKRDGMTIEVYATHEAETALENRYLLYQGQKSAASPHTGSLRSGTESLTPPAMPLDPALLLDRVARTAGEDVKFFSGLFGLLPYSRLAISQIPGNFGQGWPELIYLPTLAFLPTSARAEMILSLGGKPLYGQLSEAHEIAHQWWGNAVGWKTYHDQWLSEGFASYAAALQLKSEKAGDRAFRELLADYKKDLLSKDSKGETIESGGPIWLGQRLSNSLNPNGYEDIVYKKACWVLHMLRFVMENPRSGSDTAFFRMLRDFFRTYLGREPSTSDFAQTAAKFMDASADLDRTHKLNWFFNEWVYSTGIPHYHLKVSIRRLKSKRYRIEGHISQSHVDPSFEMPVPLLAVYGKNESSTLGRVIVTSDSGSFRFITSRRPLHVRIDDSTILAVVD